LGKEKPVAFSEPAAKLAARFDTIGPNECFGSNPDREKALAICEPRVATVQTKLVSKTVIDPVEAHVLWRETDNRLEVLTARVREGLDVDGASEFSRWLRFTGILTILPQQGFPLECNPTELSAKLDKLISDCGTWHANHERARTKPPLQIPKTEMEQVNAQLAALTKGLADLTAVIRPLLSQSAPELNVIQGGGR